MRLVVGTLAAFFLLVLPQPQPASAAWIVLRGGEVLRTHGAWKVEGTSVVFTTMQRQYTSILLSEVDVTASAQLNRQRPFHQHAETFLQANRPRPVLVFINSGLAASQRRAIEKSRPTVTKKVTPADERRARRAEALRLYATPAGSPE